MTTTAISVILSACVCGAVVGLLIFFRNVRQGRGFSIRRCVLPLCLLLLVGTSLAGGLLSPVRRTYAHALRSQHPTCISSQRNTCDGQFPVTTGCAADRVKVTQMMNINVSNSSRNPNILVNSSSGANTDLDIMEQNGDGSSDWVSLGDLNIWYSPTCETNWASFSPNPAHNVTGLQWFFVIAKSAPSQKAELSEVFGTYMADNDGSFDTQMIYAPVALVASQVCLELYTDHKSCGLLAQPDFLPGLDGWNAV
jgi:hypothetical protein